MERKHHFWLKWAKFVVNLACYSLCLLGFGWLVRGQVSKFFKGDSVVALQWKPVKEYQVKGANQAVRAT